LASLEVKNNKLLTMLYLILQLIYSL